MRAFTAVLALAFVAGCGKGGKSDDTGTGGGTNKIPEIEFGDAANAKAVRGSITDDAVTAQAATNLLLGAIGLAFSDHAVQEKMGDHVDPNRDHNCWTSPDFPLSTFTLDYTDCLDDFGISGGLIFNDDPLGPNSFDFKTITFNDTRTINGGVGFDATGASNLHWTVYDTVAAAPTPDTRVPLDVTIDGREGTITYDGGGFMRLLNANYAAWGVIEWTPYGGNPATVLVGSTNAAELTLPDEPAEPASLSNAYETCRCPTNGLMSLEVGYELEEVDVDLDDLKTTDDGVDDPEVVLFVSGGTSGQIEARNTACGEWENTYMGTDEVQVEVSSDDLQDAIQLLCDTAVITDGARCTGLRQAAANISSITVTVGTNRLATAIEQETNVSFDTAYCRP